MNKKVRSIISYFINSSYTKDFRINESKISYYITLNEIQLLKDLEDILDNAIILAKCICQKGKPVDLLKEYYLTETTNEAKKRLLTTLYSIESSLPPDEPVIKKALGDKSVEIQFLGAGFLKKKGYNHRESCH